jgi:serine/threonine protein kinase
MNQSTRVRFIIVFAAVVICGISLSPQNSQAVAVADGTLQSYPVISSDADQGTLAAKILAKLGFNEEAAQLYAPWFWGLPLLVVLILLAMLLRPWQQRTLPAKKRRPPAPSRRSKIPAPLAGQPHPEPATDKERVLKFFFNLYKQQVGADAHAPGQIYLVETRPTYPNETYEMRVMQGNEWSSRRMSIGLLGQGGGSRSKCFYVIFDSHLVLKIPSVPIPDFSTYHQQVEAEGHIVARLAPRECIVPRIGVILKAVHTFPGSDHLSEEALEKKYVQLVKSDPSFQQYLKIGPSFAFFMDLSKHFFLSATLDELHRGDQRLVSEALKNPDLLWDQHGFVCRYGEEASSVCQKLQEAYYRSEIRMRQLVNQASVSQEVSDFEFKEWYLTHLAGEKIDQDAQELPHELIERINRHLFNVVKNHRPSVEQYRRRVSRYIHETRFLQNRLHLENLVVNTLSLLDWINAKNLSLRDLKPENLFVAGDPNNYPHFLNDTMRFSIGLIDVETAVVVDADAPGQIPQPQLAGTPLYATPTHLLPNAILEEVYGDVREILLMQDWYATIAIIFKIVSGENLFVSTASVFPEILVKLKLIDPGGPDLEEDVAQISQLFWGSATAEFQEAVATQSGILSRVEVAVPKNLVHAIVKAMHNESDNLSDALARILSQQKIFVTPEKCKFLMDAPADKIAKMKNKLGRDDKGLDKRSGQRQKALDLLEQIQRLKTRLERKREAAAVLKATGAPIAADQLLEAMFYKVGSVMHLSKWPEPTPVKRHRRVDLPTDIATYQATM